MKYFLLQSKSSRTQLYHVITGTQKFRRMEYRKTLCGYNIPLAEGDAWEMMDPVRNKLNCISCKRALRKQLRELQKLLKG